MFETVTETVAASAVLPAASRARAERLCAPLGTALVVQDSENGRAGLLGAQRSAIEQELHAYHPDVVGGR